MINLKAYYNERVMGFHKNQLLEQVGHTIDGKSIPSEEFDFIVKGIVRILDLHENDLLIDLCCGNGVITNSLSKHCRKTIGVDLSDRLIEIAKNHNNDDSVTYYCCDIFDFPKKVKLHEKASKLCLFAALQHFNKNILENMFNLIENLCEKNSSIFLGFIPDPNKKWMFHDTLKKRIFYAYRKMSKTDIMGTWWDKETIKEECDKRGYCLKFIDIPNGKYGSSYRYHALITIN